MWKEFNCQGFDQQWGSIPEPSTDRPWNHVLCSAYDRDEGSQKEFG